MDGEDPSPKNCHLNEENIKELVEVLERLKNNEYKHNQDDENTNEKKSRFIISPNNDWNLLRNNLMLTNPTPMPCPPYWGTWSRQGQGQVQGGTGSGCARDRFTDRPPPRARPQGRQLPRDSDAIPLLGIELVAHFPALSPHLRYGCGLGRPLLATSGTVRTR